MNKKSIFFVSLLMVVIITLSVLATILVYSNDVYKSVTYEDELQDGVVLVCQDLDKGEFVDIKTLNKVKLGSMVYINYDGRVQTIDNIQTGGNCMLVSGIRKAENGTYFVYDDVEITFMGPAGIKIEEAVEEQ